MVSHYRKKLPKPPAIPTRIDAKRRREAEKERKQGAAQAMLMRDRKIDAADIELILGPMPECKNPQRRERCLEDLERYARTYHAATFSRPFSQDHRRFIAQLQEAFAHSSWLVRSIFRGFGKTVLTEVAAEWAIVSARKRCGVVVGSSATHSESLAASIRSSFENEDLLCDDFPEICWPVRALEGKFQRCKGQRFRGNNTFIQWGNDVMRFPSNTGAACAGAILAVFGWTGAIRGFKRRTLTGETLRPDFAIVDDPQTDESARSEGQCEKLLGVIVDAVSGLGGHDRRISIVVPATTIAPGDAIARLLDPNEYPAWVGENIPMLKTLPEEPERLWFGEYARIRRDFDRNNPGSQRKAAVQATTYYKTHRQEMDKGAEATWAECFERGTEISAIQHAMNLWIDKGDDYFWAECQGKPNVRLGSGSLVTDVDFIAKKVCGLGQRIAPADALVVTGFVDVAHDKLQWMTCAFRADFGGVVIDYGVWPEGNATLRSMEGASLSGAVFRGLCHLVERMAAQAIPKSDGEGLHVQTVLVDCGDPATRDAVFQSARGQRFPCRVIPSRGRAHHQFNMPNPKQKRITQNAFLDIWKGLGAVVVHDACVWRERFQRAVMLPTGEPGSFELYGKPGTRHRELATQFASERLVEKLAGTTGEMYKWTRVPGTRNHFLDCGVGCMVAATLEGLRYGQEIQAVVTKAGQHGGNSGNGRKTQRRGGFRAIED